MARRTVQGTDRTSQAFTDAQSLMAPTNPTNAKAAVAPSPNPSTQGVHNIDITPADNGGVTVSHSMKKTPKKGNEWDTSGPRQTNVFAGPNEAHDHIGSLLGAASHAPHAGGKGGGSLG